jgi:hypothetical protein
MEASNPIRGLIRHSRWLLWIASLLVPKHQRKAWYEAWCAKVWHWAHFLYESGRLNARTRLELANHVRSAFGDAVWLRFDRDKVLKVVRERPRTPRFCLLAIATFFLLAVISSGFAPTIRSSFSRLPYNAPDRLAHLSFTNNYIRFHLDSLFLAVSRWAEQSKTAEAVSAYSWEPATVGAARDPVEVISARVSPDFFDTLGVGAGKGRLFHSGDEGQCANCIVISNALWQYGFHHDPAIVGKQVVLQGISSTVVGVLPNRFGFVSPEISVWTVGPSPADSFTTAERTGVVLRLRPGVSISRAGEEFPSLVGSATGIDLTSIKTRVQQGTYIYLLFTMLAFIGSLVLLAYRLVNSSGPKVHLSLRDNYRWWMFFATKTVLLVATCFLVSLEGTRRAFLVFTGVVPPFAGPVCTWLFLVSTILALSWSLRDQCRRCRICLKRLGHEASVGAPASLLLDWWGTELVCSQGHGMLHVPEMHASWLDMEHWTPLDDSWKPLFESENAKVS